MLLSNSLYEVNITEDSTYRLFSVDNKPYDLVVTMEEYTRSSHIKALSIQVMDLKTGETSIIVVVGGIYSFATEDCAVLDGNKLIVIIQDTIAFIELPTKKLVLKTKVVDFGTIFAIYPFCDSYIIHGELEVVLISKNGEKVWSFSGRDIFVLPNDKSTLNVFTIQDDKAIFYDWEGNKYIVDKNGKEVLL